MEEFLETDMKGKVLYNIILPPMGSEYKLVSFKIMPRSQNVRAIVNAGFLYKLNSNNQVLDARIVFGGLSPKFTRATKTESGLKGKSLFENDTLQFAVKTLNNELIVEEDPPQSSAKYRKQLAIGLFYKGLLTLCPANKLADRYRSGISNLHDERPVSKGTQEFNTNPNIYPLNEPIQKVEALCLVSVTSCQDWEITTVEKVGNRHDGYHPIQKKLAEFNGTQCGYCTPGWVMASYSILQSKKQLTELYIEKSFGSNLCRCTGYRPILAALKTFAATSSNVEDIEDLKLCKKMDKLCKEKCSDKDWCFVSDHELTADYSIKIKLKDDKMWYRVTNISDIFSILNAEGDDSYMLVGGNTAKGNILKDTIIFLKY